ncbi:hypothetical protein FQA39_LY14295 [Lamprigera yunnana]|nr:hypothetical protein FQA39_LY14295 [Lamprigera yunnana]
MLSMYFEQRRSFTLKEALQIAFVNDLDVQEIYIEPPDANILTDKDSADEDDGGLVNNLSRRHLLAGAEPRVKELNADSEVPIRDN